MSPYGLQVAFGGFDLVRSGYTLRLAPPSFRRGRLVNTTLIAKKTRTAAIFVSHCETHSARERLVAELRVGERLFTFQFDIELRAHRLQRHTDVDVFGDCGDRRCAKHTACENVLNTEFVETTTIHFLGCNCEPFCSYYFYLAFENSICADYTTEKVCVGATLGVLDRVGRSICSFGHSAFNTRFCRSF